MPPIARYFIVEILIRFLFGFDSIAEPGKCRTAVRWGRLQSTSTGGQHRGKFII